jgi:hypothetical protein
MGSIDSPTATANRSLSKKVRMEIPPLNCRFKKVPVLVNVNSEASSGGQTFKTVRSHGGGESKGTSGSSYSVVN